MDRLLGIAAICIIGAGVTAGAASAQTTAVGYGFGSPAFATYEGESLAIFHAAGGGERRIHNSFGIGADLGFAAPWEELSDSVFTLSVNGTYYIKGTARSRRTQPFASGGYSMLFRGGSLQGVNLGAGVDHWVSNRAGLRFEFRDQILTGEGELLHFWGPRIGIVWRGR